MGRLRVSLRTKLLLSVSVLIILDSVALGQFFARHEAANIRRSVMNRGVSLARGFAYNCEYGTLIGDEEGLLKTAQGVMRETDVVYCSVHDEAGHVLAELTRGGQGGIPKNLPQAQDQGLHLGQGVDIKTFDPDRGDQIYEFSCPIYIQREERTAEEISMLFEGVESDSEAGAESGVEAGGTAPYLQRTGSEETAGEIVGHARVGISLAAMNQRLAREQRLAILLTLLVVGVSLSLTVPIIQTVVEPIRELVLGTKRVAQGDLSLRVGVKSGDEIGNLADSFNHMIEDLRRSREEIEEYNRTLEQRVAERTADLEKRNREILALNRSLQETQKQLINSARLAAMGEMSAEIGHELNNYIAVISGRADLIPLAVEKGDMDKAIQNARTIAEQTSRIQVLTNGLMDSSRQDTKETACDLAALVEETTSFVEPQNKYDCIHFSLDLQPRLPLMRLDPQQMQQVMLNLFSNAADAIGPGQEGQIIVRARHHADQGEVVLEIQDNGPGIPKEILQRVFEPSFTTKKHGHGFGLAVCHRVVTNHKGTIMVSSNANWGTVFRIVLPVGPRPNAPTLNLDLADSDAEPALETTVS